MITKSIGSEFVRYKNISLVNVFVLLKEVDQDENLSKLKQIWLTNARHKPPYAVVYGFLFYDDRLVVVKNSSLLPLLIKKAHCSNLFGHGGC